MNPLNNLNRPVYDKEFAHYRCNGVYVISGFEKTWRSAFYSAIYTSHTWTLADDFDKDIPTTGIHFFLTKKAAESYMFPSNGNFTDYDMDGKLIATGTMKNGKKDGIVHITDSMCRREITYMSGIVEGLVIHYNDDGTIMHKYRIKNGTIPNT